MVKFLQKDTAALPFDTFHQDTSRRSPYSEAEQPEQEEPKRNAHYGCIPDPTPQPAIVRVSLQTQFHIIYGSGSGQRGHCLKAKEELLWFLPCSVEYRATLGADHLFKVHTPDFLRLDHSPTLWPEPKTYRHRGP